MIEEDELLAGYGGPTEYPNRNSGSRFAIRLYRIKYLAIHYWWIAALTVAIGLGVQAYRCYKQVPLYASGARMMVNGQLNLNQGANYSEDNNNFYGTQLSLMKSGAILGAAVAHVRLLHPEVVTDEHPRIDAVQEPRTGIFDLQVTTTNPDYSPLLLNAVMDAYLESKRDRREENTNEAVSAITSEISQLDTEIRSDEQQLLDFQKENNVVFIEQQSSSAAAYLVSLNDEMARLTKEHDLLELESKDNTPNAPAPDPAAEGSAGAPEINPAIIQEQETIEKLKIERDDYSQYLKDMHPKMIALSEEISKEEKFLQDLQSKGLQDRRERIADLELQIQNLEKQIGEQNKKSIDLNQRLGVYQELKNKIAREQTMYNELASSFQNVNLNKSIDQENVVAMEPASRGLLVPPDYPIQLLYGILIGLVAGVGIIYLINRLDDRVDSPLLLEQMIDLPIIGQIPLEAAADKGSRLELLTPNDRRHVLSESLRNIRSSILFRSTSAHPKSLLICSSIPGEGKSTLAANLAITFAFAGARTLLIDADLRRGLLHSLFDAPVSPGLSDYLQQKSSWHEVVQTTAVPNLDLITRGKVPIHPGELLLGVIVDLLVHETTSEYDMVLWDSAPLMAADDTTNLCSKLDGVLFVTRVQLSSLHAVRSSLDMLVQRHAKLLGLVVNAVEEKHPGYHDRFKYQEYYAIKEDN
jgi:capsular exopolysaccharide synthesis family protein